MSNAPPDSSPTPESPEPTPMLDYKHPDTPMTLVDRLADLIRRRDRFKAGAIWLRASTGFVLLGLVILYIGSWLSDWLGCFAYLLTAVILTPLLFWAAWRWSGSRFAEASAGGGLGAGSSTASSYGEWEMQHMQAWWAAAVDVLLSGPILVLEAVGLHEERGKVDDPLLLRAADAVADLLAAGEGVPTTVLRKDDDEPGDFRRMLDYLEKHDWVGRSRDGKRVWLLTEAKKYLAANGIEVPPAHR